MVTIVGETKQTHFDRILAKIKGSNEEILPHVSIDLCRMKDPSREAVLTNIEECMVTGVFITIQIPTGDHAAKMGKEEVQSVRDSVKSLIDAIETLRNNPKGLLASVLTTRGLRMIILRVMENKTQGGKKDDIYKSCLRGPRPSRAAKQSR